MRSALLRVLKLFRASWTRIDPSGAAKIERDKLHP